MLTSEISNYFYLCKILLMLLISSFSDLKYSHLIFYSLLLKQRGENTKILCLISEGPLETGLHFHKIILSFLNSNFCRLIPCTMGANASQLEKDIGSDLFPQNEHFFGLVNFGNTCYSNSVLQALYFCKPFRDKVLEYKAKNKRTKETLLTCLADLFYR